MVSLIGTGVAEGGGRGCATPRPAWGEWAGRSCAACAEDAKRVRSEWGSAPAGGFNIKIASWCTKL